MQNGLNESFWDGLGVEIGPCAFFEPKTLFWGTGTKIMESMLWAPKVKNEFRFKLDTKSVPEALATILILLKFSIVPEHPIREIFSVP